MLNLVLTTDKLQLVTDAAATVDVHASFADLSGTTVTPGKQNTAITTATTTDIVAAPGASTTRNVKTLHIRNKHATLAVSVTVVFDANGTDYELHKATLLAGEALEYIEGIGFFTLTATGAIALLTSVETDSSQNIFGSYCTRNAQGAFLTISGTAYYVYVGRTVKALTLLFVEFQVTTAGAGAQTAEVGIFSTPTGPAKSAQTLTKLVATGTVDSVTTTGVKRNTSSFALNVVAGTHIWAACRFAMATTQPTNAGLAGDMSQGHILTTTGGGALTGLTTAAGTIPAIGTATVAPDMRITLN